jgi:hypothetical protein
MIMPRPRSKATKIAQAITGIPQNLKNEKDPFRRADTPNYGFTYGHRLTSTILRGGGS